MQQESKEKEAGFTLLEVLVVVSIIGILAGVGMFGMSNALTHYRLKTQVHALVADLRKARQLAISKQINYGVRINFADDEYILFNANGDIKTKSLNKEIEYNANDSTGGNEIEFTPVGTTVFYNGHITLRNNEGEEYKIYVNQVGRVDIRSG